MASNLSETSLSDDPLAAVNFLLQASTEYSIIALRSDGTISLWNEGARRLYGYMPEEVVGRANMALLHTSEDVGTGQVHAILETALREGKWEGMLQQIRKDGQEFTARIVTTLHRDAARPGDRLPDDLERHLRRNSELVARDRRA